MTRDGNQALKQLAIALLWLSADLMSASAAPLLVSSVLPTSRSVQVGTTATAFATVINAGDEAGTNCTISPSTLLPADFWFQESDPVSGALTGTQNAGVDIAPGAAQTFVLGITPTAAFNSTDLQMSYKCANSNEVTVLTASTRCSFQPR